MSGTTEDLSKKLKECEKKSKDKRASEQMGQKVRRG